ncbi:alpha/beta hydrolase [Luteococcus peritonei]|uniref:Alpha/beta fold hydrolase n=1 Tax=Luteococcus peritonei TaxID=88874 RepID=A0ABW4RX03_9ACTN
MAELDVTHHGRPEAVTLVLLHGITDSGSCWPDTVGRWEQDFRILAVDQRGHGSSPRFSPMQLADRMTTMVDDLLEVLEEMCPQPAVLVGHSLGGRVALAATARRPELVRGLVLEDPAVFDDTGERARPDFTAGLEAFDSPQGRAAQAAHTGWTMTESEPWALAKQQCDRDFLRGASFGPMDAVALLDGLTVPALVVAPRDSELVPAPERITNPLVRLELLDGVGHCVRRDDQEAYHRLVDPFLRWIS